MAINPGPVTVGTTTTPPRERGLMFSPVLVRAILEGTKTVTRRLVKPPRGETEIQWMHAPLLGWCLRGRDAKGFPSPVGAPYAKGDILWVRETFGRDSSGGLVYMADGKPAGVKWTPSILMPKAASRIRLEVESVRAERLHAVDEADAKREGVRPVFETLPGLSRDQTLTTGERMADAEHRAGFAVLWDQINGDRALWKSNPWVWRIQFSVALTARGFE